MSAEMHKNKKKIVPIDAGTGPLRIVCTRFKKMS
jgi:hypothetical protein